MSFSKNLHQLQKKVLAYVGKSPSRAITKVAFVQPFIQVLGYEIQDPQEVSQGFGADSENAGKVDYCLFKSGKPILLIECEAFGKPFPRDSHNRLLEAYRHSEVEFALLTNGLHFQFFADFEKKHELDEEPFWEIRFDKLSSEDIVRLQAFSCRAFNSKRVKKLASTLVSPKALREVLVKELADPGDGMVRFVLKSVGVGRVTRKMISSYQPLVKKSFREAAEIAYGEGLPSKGLLSEFHQMHAGRTGKSHSPLSLQKSQGRLFSLTFSPEDSLRSLSESSSPNSLDFNMVQ